MAMPQMVERLIILNLPHPNGLLRELRTNPEQIKNSAYARNFQEKTPTDPTVFFGMAMTPQTLSGWVTDAAARKRYVEAFEKSDFEAMLNYYKRNYPRASGADLPATPEPPKITMPVLMFHGLQRSGAECGRAVRHVEVAGKRSHARDRARRRSFRPAGRRRDRHLDDAVVAGDA